LRNSSSLWLGAFSFDVKHGKEDEGEIITTNLTPCNKVFIRSNLLCNGEKNQDKKVESKFSSCPTPNTGAVHLKIDAQVAYDIQLGHSWTLGNIRRLLFQWDWCHINTIKDELSTIFVLLRIIMYPIILGINLPDQLDF
jgi:hypothetical protein